MQPVFTVDEMNGTLNGTNQETKKHFSIRWYDLEYVAVASKFSRLKNKLTCRQSRPERVILKGVNGSFESGALTALMGPSGAGKSTLLQCVAGLRRHGRRGHVRLFGRDRISIAFIPQHDSLLELLTVREALMMASRIQHACNGGRGRTREKIDSRKIVQQMVEQLGLEVVMDTRIRLLSGGQLKRVSIGQELVSEPNVLILDEPTSGLDSSSCFSLVQVLKELTQKPDPIAILMTIHQPSARVFNMFHKVYMLSMIGKAIYEGPPEDVVPTLSNYNIPCAQFYNPADLIAEVAHGDYGAEVVYNLANAMNNNVNIPRWMSKKLTSAINKPKMPFFRHFFLLFHRHTILIVRDPLLGFLKYVIAANTAVTVGILFFGTGLADGCVPDISQFSGIHQLGDAQRKIEDTIDEARNNIGSLYFLLLYTMFSNLMPKSVNIPLLLRNLQKERFNAWYGINSYYWALVLSEIPLLLSVNLLALLVHFILTDQPFSRFWLVYAVFTMVSLAAQVHGTIIGALLSHDVVASVFVAPNTTVPLILLSGFLIKIKSMPYVFQKISAISYLRFRFEGFTVAIFGFNKCDPEKVLILQSLKNKLGLYLSNMLRIASDSVSEEEEVREGSTNKTRQLVKDLLYTPYNGYLEGESHQSAIMKIFGFQDETYWSAMLALTITLIVGHSIAYLLMKKRTKLSI